MADPPADNKPDSCVVAPPGQLLARAAEACRSGKLVQAETILSQVVRQKPDLAAAWHIRGLTAARAGHRAAAAQFLAQAARLAPDNAHYCADFAAALESAGRLTEAMSAWAHAAALQPADGRTVLRLGTLLSRLGRSEEALAYCRRAADLLLDDAGAQFQLAVLLHGNGQIEEAVVLYRRALELGPERAETHNNLAAALREAGQPESAIQHAERAIALRCDYPEALNNLGLALLDGGQATAAVDRLEAALSLDPENPEILNNLGMALLTVGRKEEAETRLRAALERRPGWPDALRNLGNLLRQSERLEEAVACYRAALDGQPQDFRTYGNLGLVLLNVGKPFEAIAVYEKALALEPEQPALRMSLGIAQLLTGDFASGWENYEWRWRSSPSAPPPRTFDAPQWTGEDLAGRTVLIHAEQGFGDTLQFCRYAPLVAARGGRVVLECQPSLTRLLVSLDGTAEIVARGAALPAFDCHVPLLSLPRLFRTTLGNVPDSVPYLRPPDASTRYWRRKLERVAALKVGIVWAGNPQRQDDRMRSCPFEALMPLLRVPDVAFFSLQKGASIRPDGTDTLIDLAPELGDFADTAAAMAALDLVITVDTAAAHLAGALGRPVWVMLGFAADWRYLLDRTDSPWYPSMRLYRQARQGDWMGVIARMADDLRDHVAGRRTGKF